MNKSITFESSYSTIQDMPISTSQPSIHHNNKSQIVNNGIHGS